MNAAARPEPLAPYRAAFDALRPRARFAEATRSAAFARFLVQVARLASTQVAKPGTSGHLELEVLPPPAGVNK